MIKRETAFGKRKWPSRAMALLACFSAIASIAARQLNGATAPEMTIALSQPEAVGGAGRRQGAVLRRNLHSAPVLIAEPNTPPVQPPAGVPVAYTVPDIVQLAASGTNFQLNPKTSYNFQPGQTMVVPSFSNFSMYCLGAALNVCSACSLLDSRNASFLAMYDCNINIQESPPPVAITPTGVPARNATTVVLLPGLGQVTGNGSLYLYQGSVLSSCETFNTLLLLANVGFSPYGSSNGTTFLTINDTAKLLSSVSPIGYYGGVMGEVNLTIRCDSSTGATGGGSGGGGSSLLLLLLLLMLLIPCSIVIVWLKRRRMPHHAIDPEHPGCMPCGRSRGVAMPPSGNSAGGASTPQLRASASVGFKTTTLSASGMELTGQGLADHKSLRDDEHLQIHEVIARGGFGIVHRGTWRNIPVAVKTVVFQVAKPTGSTLEHAATEASIAYSLTHANIVATYAHELTVIDNSTDISTFKLVLVQELCNCGTLRRLIESTFLRGRGDAMHMRRVHSILQQICAGMRHIHSKRITHADLNPNNILCQVPSINGGLKDGSSSLRAAFALDNGNCCIKVTDFGLSERLDMNVTHASNVNQGTPFYKAPETCEHGRISPASDVYSFGVIMWQLASGESPYLVVNGISTLNPHFKSWAPTVPKAYVELNAACLDPVPDRRPTFDGLIRALNGLADELSTGVYTNQDGRPAPSIALGWPPTTSEGQALPALEALHPDLSAAVPPEERSQIYSAIQPM